MRKNEITAQTRFSLFLTLFLGLALVLAPVPSSAEVSVGISVSVGPPPLPVYTQPLCPGPGFIWLPGYWAWDPAFGYYWVPGMWAPAPFTGALWTPGYWGWNNGVYIWHEGYWGPVVGFYGGINYGFGYTGRGYYGGYWSGGRYYYNRTVNNINVTNITTVYSKPVSNVRPHGPSFNGGRDGIAARPTPQQVTAERQKRSPLTNEQIHQLRLAREDRQQRATVNRGRPAVAATPKPGAFTGHGFVPAERAGASPSARQRERTGEPRDQGRYARPGGEMHRPPMEPGYPHQSPRPGPRAAEPQRNEHRPAPKAPHPSQPHPQGEHGMGGRAEAR